LITYLTVGYPTPQDTVALCLALQEGGADIIELGVPFSDPIADGPAIQRASQAALQAGMTPPGCLRLAGEMRGRGVTVPLIFMGYYNPIHSYGIDAYVQDCAQVGIDGLIVPDLPLEEAEPLQAACRAAGLALIFLVAPTSNTQRIAQIAAATQGFLYVVSRLGTTGVGAGPDADIGEQMRLIRQHATTPVAVGFGISQPDQARALAHLADGVIVGSAIVSHAAHGSDGLRQFVASLRNALHTDLRGL
jgi:tryptophan synthase alpha chain